MISTWSRIQRHKRRPQCRSHQLELTLPSRALHFVDDEEAQPFAKYAWVRGDSEDLRDDVYEHESLLVVLDILAGDCAEDDVGLWKARLRVVFCFFLS